MANEIVFLDANIFLDVLRKRKDWQNSYAVIEKVRRNEITGYVSTLTSSSGIRFASLQKH